MTPPRLFEPRRQLQHVRERKFAAVPDVARRDQEKAIRFFDGVLQLLDQIREGRGDEVGEIEVERGLNRFAILKPATLI